MKSVGERDSEPQGAVSRGRHEAFCTLCKHPKREEIEHDFINWHSPAEIAKKYRISNRGTVYRHAHVVGLFTKRRRNVRAALEHIIERAGEVKSMPRPSLPQSRRTRRLMHRGSGLIAARPSIYTSSSSE